METIRLFLAIDIPSHIRETLTEVQNRFKSLELNIAWGKPANIHLTLKFLGNTDPKQLPEIRNRMKILTPAKPSFAVSLKGMGVFPKTDKPRILWVGIQEFENNLGPLYTIISEEMAKIGFPAEDRKFNPHLTIGRIKSSKGKSRLTYAIRENEDLRSEPFEVSSVNLYKSQLTPKGAVYTVLEEFKLGRSPESQPSNKFF